MDSSFQTHHQTGSWTNEKHLRFLNTMEASFVRAMFERNLGQNVLRLDRHLPDSSESTLDSKTHRRSDKHAIPVRRSRMNCRSDKRARRVLSGRCNPSQDQVVPRLESKTSADKEERDGPTAPAI